MIVLLKTQRQQSLRVDLLQKVPLNFERAHEIGERERLHRTRITVIIEICWV